MTEKYERTTDRNKTIRYYKRYICFEIEIYYVCEVQSKEVGTSLTTSDQRAYLFLAHNLVSIRERY